MYDILDLGLGLTAEISEAGADDKKKKTNGSTRGCDSNSAADCGTMLPNPQCSFVNQDIPGYGC